MEKKRKRLTNREFWEKYGIRFEETDRKLLERIAYYERKIAEREAAGEFFGEGRRRVVDLVRDGR